MQIIINNATREIEPHSSLQHLLVHLLNEKSTGIAVAVNNSVIPKINWADHQLKDNDEVLIIKATQGG